MSTIAVIALAFCAGVTASFFTLPVWVGLLIVGVREGTRPDWLGFIGNIIGSTFAAVSTIGAGVLAYTAAVRQIADARREAREAKILSLNAEVANLAADLDRLKFAKAYLETVVSDFRLNGHPSLIMSTYKIKRQAALDSVSLSAVNAPYGYGTRIGTVMTRFEKIGDRMAEARAEGYNISQIEEMFVPNIQDAVAGLASIAAQIGADLPTHEKWFLQKSDERDALIRSTIAGS